MKRFLLSITFSFLILFAFGQGPGNVTTNLELWLKANTGVTTSGNDVSAWADQSVNGNSVDQGVSGQRPELLSNGINFNEAIDFELNNSDFLSDATPSLADLAGAAAMELFVLYQTETGTGQEAIWHAGPAGASSAGDNFNFNLTTSNVGIHSADGSAAPQNHRSFTPPLTAANIYHERHAASAAFSAFTMEVNGGATTNVQCSNCASTVGLSIGELNISSARLSNGVRGFYADGKIAEVIAYSGTMSSTERQRVWSYLALKYGTTLDQTSAFDYLASDGSTKMWDGTVASGHNEDIAGIGRDDNSALNQKQSKSVNSDAIVSIGLGTIAADNSSNSNTFAADNRFMTWGNDGTAREQSGATTSNLPTNINRRMTRVWRVEENNGDAGSCQIQIDITGLGYSGSNANNYALLVDDDGSNFSNANLFIAASFSSNIITFNGVNLADADFFTLGESDAGFTDNALDFDGSNDYVDLGNITAMNGASALTIECWFKLDALDNFDRIVVKEDGQDPDQTGIAIGSSNQALNLLANNGASGSVGTTGNVLSTGTWIHVAYVFDGSGAANADRLKCYINGAAVSLTFGATPIPATLATTSHAAVLGVEGEDLNVNHLDGCIDEVRIWNIALTASQISDLYNDEFSDPTAPASCLIAYYQMNETTGTNLPDESGNGNNGTLTNMMNDDWVMSGANTTSQTAPTCASLPVELTDFRAENMDGKSLLTWQTASEINNEGFEIEWSVDNRNWENIGFVAGVGDTFEKQYYEFIHDRPASGINYYRLKQMDFDGAFDYSNTVSVDVPNFKNLEHLKLYPNPTATGSFTLSLPQTDFESAEMNLFDLTGQMIQSQSLTDSQTEIRTADLPKGIYMVAVNLDGRNLFSRIVVQ